MTIMSRRRGRTTDMDAKQATAILLSLNLPEPEMLACTKLLEALVKEGAFEVPSIPKVLPTGARSVGGRCVAGWLRAPTSDPSELVPFKYVNPSGLVLLASQIDWSTVTREADR